MLLPVTQNFSKLWPTVGLALCYGLAFYCLTFAIKTIPLSIVYGTWSGVGIFLIALLSYFFYGQNLNWPSILGLGFIILGVVLVNVYSNVH